MEIWKVNSLISTITIIGGIGLTGIFGLIGIPIMLFGIGYTLIPAFITQDN